jgi:hypothetical protein
MLLGEVGEVEVARERAGDELGALERPRGDELLGVALEAAFVAGADDERSQPLDVAQQLAAAVVGDDAAKDLAKQANVAPQLGRDLVSRRLSLSRGGRTPASRGARAATPR